MKIAIVGRSKDTGRYELFFSKMPAEIVTTLSMEELFTCDGVILPGGGDITPAFFGDYNKGSENIDTELDILQIQAAEHCIHYRKPLLGICKGLQVINVTSGGTLIQNLPACTHHQNKNEDQYHDTFVLPDSFLHRLYGPAFRVNSAHHQGIDRLGRDLRAIQWCSHDHCIEAIEHTSLPVIGLQWHPERLEEKRAGISSLPLLDYFLSLF